MRSLNIDKIYGALLFMVSFLKSKFVLLFFLNLTSELLLYVHFLDQVIFLCSIERLEQDGDFLNLYTNGIFHLIY